MSIPAFMLEAATTAAPDPDAPADDAIAGEYVAAGEDAPPPPPPPFVPGVFEDMPPETYHAIEAIGSGGVEALLQSGRHFRLMRDPQVRRKVTPAMLFGQAVHIAILEPERYADAVTVEPAVNKRTNAGKATLAAFHEANRHRIILTPAQRARALRCGEELRAHPSASKLLAGAKTELSLFWIDGQYGVPCKARLDVWNFGIAADIKTTVDASPDGFGKAIGNYGYQRQGAHYTSGCEHALGKSPGAFVFLPVEADEPHCVGAYALDHADIRAGRQRVDEALARYRVCMDSGKWSGYSDKIETARVPGWTRKL